MATIYLETLIKADVHKVFDLARDIDLHQLSASGTKEKAISGCTGGLIDLNETVTWRAKHLGFYQCHTAKIIEMAKPHYFTDVMEKGTFKSFTDLHLFKEKKGHTLMIDLLEFESPFGLIGKLFNRVFLIGYLRGFLLKRNTFIKKAAECKNFYRRD